jgi:hypothetical protein
MTGAAGRSSCVGERHLHAVQAPGEAWLPAIEGREDAYVHRIARTRGARVARATRKRLSLFLDYAERNWRCDVARLPWWEYPLALEWICKHTEGTSPTRARARRLLDTLRDFLQSLVRAGRLSDCWSLEQARAMLGSRRTFGLLARPPYRGPETWTVLRAADGRLVTFTMADFWLCLLWRHTGQSWAALEARVSQAPRPGDKLAAVRTLREHLLRVGCPDPFGLLVQESTIADIEDALRWLNEPDASAPGPPSAPPDHATATLPTATLVDRVVASQRRMPRREMEELLRRGGSVLPALTSLLDGERRPGGAQNPLWIIVMLGELRRPAAIAALGRFLACDDGELATAASEALGKIGTSAVPFLARAATHGEEMERLHAYGALGMIHTEEAYRVLSQALLRDDEFGDVIARALAQHGRRDAIEPLHLSSARAPRRMRREFECAIFSLVHGAPTPEPFEQDWRLRYRRVPRLGWSFPPSWISMAALAHRRQTETGEEPGNGGRARPLPAIIADGRLDAGGGPCPRCGTRIWRPTGLPLCRHTAPALVRLQCALIEGWVATGLTDAWTALDACDAADERLARSEDARTAGWERDRIAIGRGTLYWLVALRREDMRAGADYLRVIARDFTLLQQVGCRLHA